MVNTSACHAENRRFDPGRPRPMVVKDFTKLFKRTHYNKWVALNPGKTKVVAYGRDPKQVLEQSKQKGVKDPILTFAIRDYSSFVT